jgi:hypothetical protein
MRQQYQLENQSFQGKSERCELTLVYPSAMPEKQRYETAEQAAGKLARPSL